MIQQWPVTEAAATSTASRELSADVTTVVAQT